MILLDTHAWLWHTVAPERLSLAARQAIERAETILVSTVSCLEVVTLQRRGRIALDRDPSAWVRHALAATGTEPVSVDVEIATRAGGLRNPFPGDPADRVIFATALSRGVPLVTRDRAIRDFDPTRTIW